MPKTRQSAALGSLADFTSAPHVDDNNENHGDRITALEKRVKTLEGLLADVMMELDKVSHQEKEKIKGSPKKKKGTAKVPSSENKKKKVAPSDIITKLLKKSPLSRHEIQAKTELNEEAIIKCVGWMVSNEMIEKTGDKDSDGNSRWRLTSS